jgi:hypothetical protein
MDDVLGFAAFASVGKLLVKLLKQKVAAKNCLAVLYQFDSNNDCQPQQSQGPY